MARACFPNVFQFPIRVTLFLVSFLFSRCKLCFHYTAGNFNEKPSMRALAENLGARASKHLLIFGEQFEQSLLYWVWEHRSNWMGRFDTPPSPRPTPFIYKIYHFIYFLYSFGICVRFISCQISYHCI